jgi:hypothetical protein
VRESRAQWLAAGTGLKMGSCGGAMSQSEKTVRRDALGRLRRIGKSVFYLVCLLLSLGRVDGELVNLNQELINYTLDWMPWKSFNYSVPSAVEWCAEPLCLECSEPVEWEDAPYETCRAYPRETVSNLSATAEEEVVIEVPHRPVHLLACPDLPAVTGGGGEP